MRKKTIADLKAALEQRVTECISEFNHIAVKAKGYSRARDIEAANRRMYHLALELKPVAHVIEQENPKIFKLMDMLIEYYKSKEATLDDIAKERIIKDLQGESHGNTGTDIAA